MPSSESPREQAIGRIGVGKVRALESAGLAVVEADSDRATASKLRRALWRLSHAAEAVELAETSQELRDALTEAYAYVPEPDEDHCGCVSCTKLRETRDAVECGEVG